MPYCKYFFPRQPIPCIRPCLLLNQNGSLIPIPTVHCTSCEILREGSPAGLLLALWTFICYRIGCIFEEYVLTFSYLTTTCDTNRLLLVVPILATFFTVLASYLREDLSPLKCMPHATRKWRERDERSSNLRSLHDSHFCKVFVILNFALHNTLRL